MKKLLGILGAVTFTLAPAASVISCGNDGAPAVITGDLSKDLEPVANKIVDFKGSTVTAENALSLIVKKATKLKVEEVTVQLTKENELHVISKGSDYYPDANVKVLYIDDSNPTINADLVIINTDLGETNLAASLGAEVRWAEFKKVVKQANPLLDVTQLTNEGVVDDANNSSAKWNVNFKDQTVYKDHPRNISFTFTIAQK